MSETILSVENVYKNFDQLQVLKGINLEVRKGEVISIIGSSGSGKSTLLRCMNVLEQHNQGDILLNGESISTMDPKKLHTNVGIVFQNFNLFNNLSVLENCVKPQMVVLNRTREDAENRAMALLTKVGMQNFAQSNAIQLSGGQKQRVAIARALANDPDILLCDEATSALDPQTTKTILKLLKDLNKKLNITIVVITHEMEVVKEICDRVAVMQDGFVVELNTVQQIFSNPQENITKEFISTTSNLSKLDDLLESNSDIIHLEPHQKLLRIDFIGESTSEAIISQISKQYDTEASIIFANVEVIKEEILGSMVIRLSGQSSNQDAAIVHLKEIGIKVEVIKHGPVVS